MRIAIFLGPSLPVAEARSILDAVYLPPAQQADIATLASRDDKPDVIGLIDGVFMDSLSVWHNEILYALQRGVRIYGASSMGALRAAETAVFGMVGVGEIYRMYADGTLEDDDEVALTYADRYLDYLKLSEPMVNIRATLAQATAQSLLKPITAERVIAVAKSIHYAERTIPTLLSLCERDIGEDEIDVLRKIMANDYVDLKRLDAIALLKTLAALADDGASASQPSFTFNPSYVFETLYNRDRDVRHGGTTIPLARVANYTALHHPGFDELNFNALNRVMTMVLANLIGVKPSEAEIDRECDQFRRRIHIAEHDEAVAGWCSQNDINSKEFRMLMQETAACRKLHRWLMANRFFDRNTRFLLDQMRLDNIYAELAECAGDQQLTVERNYPGFPDNNFDDLTLEELAADQLAHTGWTVNSDLVSWCDDSGFHTAHDLRLELLRAHLYRRVQARVREVLLQMAERRPRKKVSRQRRNRSRQATRAAEVGESEVE